jgi:hypothetical protein
MCNHVKTVLSPSRFWRRVIPIVSNPGGLAVDRWLVRATGHSIVGRAYLRAGGYPVRPHLLLETTHWRSGPRRSVVLPYGEDGDRLGQRTGTVFRCSRFSDSPCGGGS